ncbi:MAG: hybrid sensor histidine kinase/response regulator [Ferruginibacter sp.]|nr:hybrid sensor histidine kinase/response regulator [Ferruginibacter sp.]
MEPLENSISILIIEDNPGDQVLLEAHLENTHLSIAKITMASTIAEGIRYLQQDSFSLIFLDFFLPDSNGLESYTELTKINSKIPVILLSGLSDTALSLKAISLGAQDFLLKGSYDSQSLEKSVWYSIERKKNIELLKENNERYDIISKATNDIIWDWDLLTHKVKWIGQGLKNYLPLDQSLENIPGNFWVRGLHADERKKVVGGLHKVIEECANSCESDYRFLKNDGTYAHINSRGYILKDEDQKPIRMIGSLQDITDRKNAELETQKARREAEEATKTQEQFLANMSHEIRTPMNGVIGMTQLLSSTALSADQKEYVATIQESAANLMVIINDILDLTKIVAGKISLIKADYIFSDIVNNSIKINQYRADEKGIVLKSHIDKNIHPFLCGDAVRLNQILVNLVGNAIKFTEQGEVCVNVHLLEENEQSVTLEFVVTDTGIGIAQDKVEFVFERFIQISGASTRKYGGTGLGLTITRQLIELQGGTIHVKSEQDKGSVFTFYLTIQKGKSPVLYENKPAPAQFANTLEGVQILLVEDNIINQKVASKCLSTRGALLDVANHGKEAIEWLKKKKYDIILMDLQMPEMDGYEATRIIRTEMTEAISITPIIAMTASALIADREKCLQAGMNDYIAKPFFAQELNEKILMQLEK